MKVTSRTLQRKGDVSIMSPLQERQTVHATRDSLTIEVDNRSESQGDNIFASQSTGLIYRNNARRCFLLSVNMDDCEATPFSFFRAEITLRS